MARPQRIMLSVVFLGILVWLGVTIAMGVGVQERLPEPGFQVPAFALDSLDGRPFTPDTLQGQPWILHFWATWCSSCQQELPELASFAREHPELTVLWVSVGEEEQAVSRYLAGQPVVGPIFLDPQQELYARFSARGLPTSVWVDARGVIRHRVAGPMSRSQMDSLLATLP